MRATTSVDEAVEGADVVMMLRIQHERMHGHFIPSVREYFTLFGLTPERLRRASRDVIVMHPGPMNRGVEIDSEVADGPYSVILEQVANGVAVRMAVLYLLAGHDADDERRSTSTELMKTMLLKGGRVVDPANGRDGEFDVLIEDGRIARDRQGPAGRRRRGVRDAARAGSSRRASSTSTCTCASPARSTRRRRHRHRRRRRRRVHRGRLHAEHRSGERPRRDHASSS